MAFGQGYNKNPGEYYRDRCIAVGENMGLYKGETVSKGRTPNYLPEFIAIESNKRNI